MQLKSTQNSWSCNKRSVTNSTIQLASKVRTFPTKSTFQVSLKPNTPSSNFYHDYNQTNNIDPENPAHRSNLPWKRKKRQLSIKIPARESKCWRRRKTAKKVRRPISSAQFRNHSRSKNNRGSHYRARSDSTSRFQKRAAAEVGRGRRWRRGWCGDETGGSPVYGPRRPRPWRRPAGVCAADEEDAMRILEY